MEIMTSLECAAREKTNACLQIFVSALGKYLPCQVYCSVPHSRQTQHLEMSTRVHLLIDLQNGGRIWNTYLRQMRCEIPACAFCVNAHIYIFFPEGKKCGWQSAGAWGYAYERGFSEDSHASPRCPSAGDSLVIWTNVCLVLWSGMIRD